METGGGNRMKTTVSQMKGSDGEAVSKQHREQFRVTFAVGIWTAIDGVDRRPGAEGCMAGGCIGLKAPCKDIHEKKSQRHYPLQYSSLLRLC